MVSTDFTSTSSVAGLTVSPALREHLGGDLAAGHLRLAERDLDARLGQVVERRSILAGLSGGTAISMLLVAKSSGSFASPACTTVSMLLGLAEANTSAGAPLPICSARPELGPKLNSTVVPGWSSSNCLPSSVKDSVSEAAAKTRIVTSFFALLPSPSSLPQAASEVSASRTARTGGQLSFS